MTAPSAPDPPNMDRSLVEVVKSKSPMLTSAASDAELIVAARAGDEAAYGLLYRRHVAAAYRLARQIVKAPADVDDVVAETFTRVLSAMKGGNGPAEAFRPYLLTAIRRVAFDVLNGQRRQIPTDDVDLPDLGAAFSDPMVADLERSLITEAFRSLPERWSAVLWYLDVEQAKPAEVATLLGLSANGVSVLRRRAREGLKEAYLQLHLSAGRARANCAPTVRKLSRYVRGRLSKRQVRDVEAHLANCVNCTLACSELTAVNDTLGGVLGPVVLGAAATGYLAAGQAPGPAAGGGAGGGHFATARLAHGQAGLRSLRLASRRVAELVTHHPIASAATAAAAASIAVPSVYFLQPPRGPAGGIAAPVIAGRHSQTRTAGQSPTGRPTRSARPTGSARPSATASPKPSGSSSRTPKPTPTASAPTRTPSTSPSASSSASPTPTPTRTVSAKAKLAVSVQVAGLLNLGVTALVTVNVSDPGSAATGPVTANITLPSGITLLGLTGSSSWSCSATGSGQSCTHGALGAGVATSLSFNVLVVNLTGCGNSVLATATSGSLSASGGSSTKVQCGLLP
jgi:RNA polymerase sigma factor (sigma-70 family)